MRDLIDRQEAIDMANDMYQGLSIVQASYSDIGRALVKFLNLVPSAQPEIIRCKDCKHYEGDIMGNPWGVCCHSGWTDGQIGYEVSDNGWCYRAERRTDGSD